ncbi:MAG: DUF4062 domain-containing protein [Bacteroidales bacterium]|nr:DUF4062 domain-containing protein [Bacteroidales bacterium]
MTADGNIEIMIASTVYGFEDQLKWTCALFEELEYRPVNSHYKTMPVNPAKSNKENCLDAVRNADCVFGIIRPFYGSGKIGGTSITHEEMKLAIEIKKPHWFVVHRDVRVARELLKQFMYNKAGGPKKDFKFKPLKIFDDIRLIDLYNDTIQNGVPPEQRIGHWTDEYLEFDDIKKIIKTQFSDKLRVMDIIDKMKQL